MEAEAGSQLMGSSSAGLEGTLAETVVKSWVPVFPGCIFPTGHFLLKDNSCLTFHLALIPGDVEEA